MAFFYRVAVGVFGSLYPLWPYIQSCGFLKHLLASSAVSTLIKYSFNLVQYMMLLPECNTEDNDTSDLKNTLNFSTNPSYQKRSLNWSIMCVCVSDILTFELFLPYGFIIELCSGNLIELSHWGFSFIKTRSAGDEQTVRKGPVTQRNQLCVPTGLDMNLKDNLVSALQVIVDIQYHPHWQLVHLSHCRVTFYCCTCAEFAGKLISPEREEHVN